MHRGYEVSHVFTSTCGQLLAGPHGSERDVEVLVEKKVKG
jgi:hypothetical protein